MLRFKVNFNKEFLLRIKTLQEQKKIQEDLAKQAAKKSKVTV